MPAPRDRSDTLRVGGFMLPFFRVGALVAGSGAAGLNAADALHALGRTDVAILTEGWAMGTSRNTGSDKQTYYKLTLAGGEPDSVLEAARTLFAGGSMHGDVALVEAALSPLAFAKLVSIGVPFPHDRYGQYVGYKTDHDPRQRATSCGPYTSRFMVERLERQVRAKGIRIFDGFRAIAVLTAPDASAPEGRRAIGVLAVDRARKDGPSHGLCVFACSAIAWATGGPGGMYRASVYPESVTCATGAALEAGAPAANLTESQYGIASTEFRWNLSGSYQQVLPRYVSTAADGSDEREFLEGAFADGRAMLDACFLKGYQWPFDAARTGSGGSSNVDLLVHDETVRKGRRVFLDFRRNPTAACRRGPGGAPAPSTFDPDALGEETRTYLARSGALQDTPIERLRAMNPGAADLYLEHGIDLAHRPLEIAVCAQHNNGGLLGDLWWESGLRRFFPIGEANGSFGAKRPGGSALNSTQVGSLRAAQAIAARYADEPPTAEDVLAAAEPRIAELAALAGRLAAGGIGRSDAAERGGASGPPHPSALRRRAMERMSRAGGHVRSLPEVRRALEETARDLAGFEAAEILGGGAGGADGTGDGPLDLVEAFIDRDVLVAQAAYLSAIEAYLEKGGPSRGGYLVRDAPATGFAPDGFVQETRLRIEGDGRPRCEHRWVPVRPIPLEDGWFETVWKAYREGEVWR